MLKIYSTRERELKLLPLLAEYKVRVTTNYPIKGRTRKVKGKNAYKVINFPLGEGYMNDCNMDDFSCSMHTKH